MTDNYINVTVTSKENKRVTVSTQDPGFEVTATTDTGKFWAQTAENWATSDTIVENKDYSSKYYANKSKASEENARVYENAVKETYNEFKGSIDIALESVNHKIQQSIAEIEKASSGIKNDIVNDIKSTGFYIKDGDIYYLDENGNEQKFYSDIKFIVREY